MLSCMNNDLFQLRVTGEGSTYHGCLDKLRSSPYYGSNAHSLINTARPGRNVKVLVSYHRVWIKRRAERYRRGPVPDLGILVQRIDKHGKGFLPLRPADRFFETGAMLLILQPKGGENEQNLHLMRLIDEQYVRNCFSVSNHSGCIFP